MTDPGALGEAGLPRGEGAGAGYGGHEAAGDGCGRHEGAGNRRGRHEGAGNDRGVHAADGGKSRSGWVAARVMGDVVARFREGAAELPGNVWRRWGATLAAGCVVAVGVAIGLVVAGRHLDGDGAFAWESDFLRALDASPLLSFSVGVWIQTLGTDITLAIVSAFAAGVAAWDRRPLHAISIVLAFVGSDLIVRFAWLLWDRPRPDLILDGAAAPGFASFPSGHAAESTAVYGILAFIWARSSTSSAERLTAAGLAATAVLLVGLGRLRMGVHWPTDILAGALLGLAWLATLAIALSRAARAAK